MRKIIFLIAILVFGVAMLFDSCSSDVVADTGGILEFRGGHGNNGNFSGSLCACIEQNYPYEELSDVEEQALIKMREEEKLARDVYIKMYEKWHHKVFNNISKSEQKHMDAILCLINKYELSDPVGDNDIGEFENNDLQELYYTLVDVGNQSLVSALTVGATIEDLDIYDLMELSQDVNNQDILAVFNDLAKGSRNHMRAFYGQLVNMGESYTPQYISQELFDSIINSEMERGGSICNGTNSGNRGHKGKKGKKGRKGGHHGHRGGRR